MSTDAQDPVVVDLIAWRKELGLTQTDMAGRMGVSQSSVAQFESPGNDPRMSTVRRYTTVLALEAAQALEKKRAESNVRIRGDSLPDERGKTYPGSHG